MRLRAAVRYSEYKSRKRLPSSIPTDCAVCQDKGLQDRYNCDGYGNDNYKVNIGVMTFFQCPLSARNVFRESTTAACKCHIDSCNSRSNKSQPLWPKTTIVLHRSTCINGSMFYLTFSLPSSPGVSISKFLNKSKL